jgi:hypothetical protein
VSGLDELFVNVIDPDAARRSLLRWLRSDADVMRTIEAAALVHLDCGHVRPMNVWLEPGDELDCLVCGSALVVELELIEPTEFPHPDSLEDLPGVS